MLAPDAFDWGKAAGLAGAFVPAFGARFTRNQTRTELLFDGHLELCEVYVDGICSGYEELTQSARSRIVTILKTAFPRSLLVLSLSGSSSDLTPYNQLSIWETVPPASEFEVEEPAPHEEVARMRAAAQELVYPHLLAMGEDMPSLASRIVNLSRFLDPERRGIPLRVDFTGHRRSRIPLLAIRPLGDEERPEAFDHPTVTVSLVDVSYMDIIRCLCHVTKSRFEVTESGFAITDRCQPTVKKAVPQNDRHRQRHPALPAPPDNATPNQPQD